MTKYQGLGRGLGSLIPSQDENASTGIKSGNKEIMEVAINSIEANPHQPRTSIEETNLDDLVNSIRVHGIIQPLLVSPTKDGYQLIAGERRFRAAKILGLKTIPAIVRRSDEVEKLELAIIENMQREDLNPLERANAYHRLIEEFSYTQDEVARKLGQSRSQVANGLRLLQLPEEVKKAIINNKITEGHAKALLSLSTGKEQLQFLEKIISNELTVRDVESQVRKVKVKSHQRKKGQNYDVIKKEDLLTEALRTKVKITKRGGKGKITIEFYSDEELNSLINKLTI